MSEARVYGMADGTICKCVPVAIGQFVIAMWNGDPDGAVAILNDAQSKHLDGEPDGFTFACMGMLYLVCARACQVAPPDLLTWADEDAGVDDPPWPDGAMEAAKMIGLRLTPATTREAYEIWLATPRASRWRLLVELAALAMAAFETFTNHHVDGSCMEDPCLIHERARAFMHN